MPHTHKTTIVALAIRDIIKANRAVIGLDDNDFVAYGDHNNFPTGKAVTVTSGTKRRTLAGVTGPGGRTLNNMEVVISIYYSVLENEETARLAVDVMAENVEDLLHEDTTVGGIIIHGFVQEWVPGILYRETSMFRVVQLHFVGQTKTNVTT